MTEPMRVGVVGCGVIAKHYVERSVAFDTWRPVACADLYPGVAETFAEAHDLRCVEPVEELYADPEVELVLNLTPPTAHAAVTRATLEAGKHVHSEKPLATSVADGRDLVAEAARRGLRLGCAPDTFLSSPYETGRRLLLEGAIGEPLGATAMLLNGGPDAWHPNADWFYKTGGGPLLDIGPYHLTALVDLLGRVASVAAFAGTPSPERVFGTGPRTGEMFAAEVPTQVTAVLLLESGAQATFTVSFEARGQYVTGMQIHGSEGTLLLPDANAFDGHVSVRRGRGRTRRVPFENRGAQEVRGIGLDELVVALRAGRPHRATGELALHVLEVAEAIERAASGRRVVDLD